MKTTKIKPAFVEEEPPEPPGEDRMEVPAGGIIMYVNADTPAGFAKVDGLHFVMASSSTTVNKTPTADELTGHDHGYPASSTDDEHTHLVNGLTSAAPTATYFHAGETSIIVSALHTHDVKEADTSQNEGHSHPGGRLAAAGTVLPPYRVLNFIKCVPSGDGAVAPIGSIVMIGAGVTVPDGWAICDGDNGTVDMRERFAYGAEENGDLLTAGGSKTHVHPASTTASAGSHNHTYKITIYQNVGNTTILGGTSGYNVCRAPHTHIVSTLTTPIQAAHDHIYPQSSAAEHMPPFLYLYYIQRVT